MEMQEWNRINDPSFYTGDFNFGGYNIPSSPWSFDAKSESQNILKNEMKLERKIDGIPVRKVYVGNIPREAKNRDMHKAFEHCGEIVQLFISRKYQYGATKNTTFGFVTFRNTEDAASAITGKKIFIGKKRLYVSEADSWHQPIVNPDGSVQYFASLSYDGRAKLISTNCHKKDDENDIDGDAGGAVGVITVRSTPYEEIKLCPISMLNDDCLEHIFSRLPLDSKIVASNVCKRWQTVIENMCKNMESINFKDHFSNKPVQPDKLQTIFEKVGSNLKEIICKPINEFMPFDRSFISIVARYCTKLEVLDIANVEIAKRSFLFLSRQCPNLKKVTFSACSGLTDNELGHIIAKSDSKLEEINLLKMSTITGRCFTNLHPPVRHIAIERCINVRPELLMMGLTHLKDSLKSLTLKNCLTAFRHYDIDYIAGLVPDLEYLNLSHIHQISPTSSLNSLGKFTGLLSLDLTSNIYINDSIISAIVTGCKMLKCLNLSGNAQCLHLTSQGIAELSNILTLEELHFNRLNQVNDSCLKRFSSGNPSSRIKKLICCSCQNLSDKGTISIMSSCKELEYLDVRRCTFVTNETVKKALSIVKKRKCVSPLRIMLAWTNVSIADESLFNHPLLKLDFTEGTLLNELIKGYPACHTYSDFCLDIDCDCCGELDDEDNFLTDSDEDFDDFLVDFEDFDSDSDLQNRFKFFLNVL